MPPSRTLLHLNRYYHRHHGVLQDCKYSGFAITLTLNGPIIDFELSTCSAYPLLMLNSCISSYEVHAEILIMKIKVVIKRTFEIKQHNIRLRNKNSCYTIFERHIRSRNWFKWNDIFECSHVRPINNSLENCLFRLCMNIITLYVSDMYQTCKVSSMNDLDTLTPITGSINVSEKRLCVS